MFKFRKIPKYTIRRPMKTYPTETTEQQLRIMRAHMAGITTEISNIRVLLGQQSAVGEQLRAQLAAAAFRAGSAGCKLGACGQLGHPDHGHQCTADGVPRSAEEVFG